MQTWMTSRLHLLHFAFWPAYHNRATGLMIYFSCLFFRRISPLWSSNWHHCKSVTMEMKSRMLFSVVNYLSPASQWTSLSIFFFIHMKYLKWNLVLFSNFILSMFFLFTLLALLSIPLNLLFWGFLFTMSLDAVTSAHFYFTFSI